MRPKVYFVLVGAPWKTQWYARTSLLRHPLAGRDLSVGLSSDHKQNKNRLEKI